MKIAEMVRGFLFDKEADGARPNTIAAYRNDLKNFTEFCATQEITELTAVDADLIRRYLHYLRTERRLKPKSVQNHWIALCSLYTWAGEKYTLPHVAHQVKCPKAPPPDIEPLTKEDVVKLLKAMERARPYQTTTRKAAERARPTAERDQVIILLLLDTGIRVTELCELTLADCDLNQGKLHIQESKGRLAPKSRYVYFGRTARKALWQYVAHRKDTQGELPPSAPLISLNEREEPMDRHEVRRLLERCGDRAGVADVHPHKFRHTFAITYLRNGGDAFTLQQLLGHSSLDMVKLYLKLAQTDAQDAHKRASPADNWHL
jgi:integrase/recombinase XerD